MSRAINVASSAADAQGYTGSGALVGVWVLNGAAVANTVQLRDGTSASGPVIAQVTLAANASAQVPLPAVEFGTGVYVDRDGVNASTLILYVGD